MTTPPVGPSPAGPPSAIGPWSETPPAAPLSWTAAPPPYPSGYPHPPAGASGSGGPYTAPAGTPYHRLARNAAHRWWRPLLGTLLVLVGVAVLTLLLIGVWMAAAELTGQPDGPDGSPSFGPIPETGFLLASLAVMTPVVLLAARAVQARPAGTVSSVTGGLRWRWLARCLLLAVPAVVLIIGGFVGLMAATGDLSDADVEGTGWVGVRTFAISLAVLLALVPLQAAAEEYLCRGWLLQAAGAYLRNSWLAIVPQALVFATIHGLGTGWGFADLMVFGLVTGWLTVRTGGLEAAIGLHVVNNLLAFSVVAATGELATDVSAADAPWQSLVVNLVVVPAYALVVDRLAARRGLATTVPA